MNEHYEITGVRELAIIAIEEFDDDILTNRTNAQEEAIDIVNAFETIQFQCPHENRLLGHATAAQVHHLPIPRHTEAFIKFCSEN